MPSSGACGRDVVDPALQIATPVVGLDAVERRDDVVERVGELAPVAVANAEEGPREIVDRALAAGLLANHAVDVEPDQLAFAVIILAALPAAPRLRRPPGDDRIVGGVDERTPAAAGRAGAVRGRRRGDRIERVLLREHPRARAEHVAPELRLALVDPQQAVLHRHAIVGGPQVRTATELAVPAVRILVRQQVAVAQFVVPLGEIAAPDAVFGAAMMLQPDAAQVVGDGEQEIVMVVMLAPNAFTACSTSRLCAAICSGLASSSAGVSAMTSSVTSGVSGMRR